MHLTITYQDKEYPITVEETEIVANLKNKIDNLINISVDRLELKCNGIVLDCNSHTLNSYKVTDHCKIEVNVLPPQLHSSLLFPSNAIYSICAILLVYFSTHPSIPSSEETTESTAMISCIIMIVYLVFKSLFSLFLDYPAKPTVGLTRAISTAITGVLICAMLSFELCYRKNETSILCTIIGAINCISCIMGLYFHHTYLSKGYNAFGELAYFPSKALYSFISCPNNLFEGLFFTSFMFCTSFTKTSIILCILNWVAMVMLSQHQHDAYKKTFKKFPIRYRLIPFIW
ncbi:hypothetical protein EDI_166150 [Entamoeba dispar SAW760]|uniref:Ubiquitin-like domain-containing protein n=1 Tax=Entamoeba dispar (strain ATCC PRA-260 / SAW760) TaxID=370354 RepID=B0EAE1_ENTDS|nr:uncharacterized protein EDI_166150 [Entamoeba dispar SAW760]EDR28495.1 hypothetical protein EDI_166150 [Entamoeba dispar SAW760]|eukprot:EDR28495.1 hypothetical protein EDI_166150 [Entamoeba dispar SAW760]